MRGERTSWLPVSTDFVSVVLLIGDDFGMLMRSTDHRERKLALE